ncbi:hypothetical protein [Pleionea sediminis]|uniref:hypothetical protein n=1 Tax=Pleionea sediminis TaxID=2569479 RepID=UPI0011849421|nr:hypothetical protein [Pleionea sediminis]
MRTKFAMVIILLLISCTHHQHTSNDLKVITAIPKSAKFSGWILDQCNNRSPIQLKDLKCPQLGGEIYIVEIIKALDPSTKRIVSENRILVVKHGLFISSKNNSPWCFDLAPASPKLYEATGVKLISIQYVRDCTPRN